MPDGTPSASTAAVLERLTRLHPKLIDLSLGRIERLLARLDHPERDLAPVVHIAGTNGKGSVAAFLRAMAEAAGLRVHVYTSPHLVRFNERIHVAGRIIEDAPLVALLEEVERANGGEPITFFEATTAAAFLAFARAPADLVILETGLGGRLDATNVIARPAATAITPVSLDHQSFLGPDIASIAGEKAAIQKEGVLAVVGPQVPEAAAVIDEAARAAGAAPWRHGREWSVAPDGAGIVYRSPLGERRLPRPALVGRHQIDNAGTAVAVAERLAAPVIPAAAIAAGLARAEWPARLQRLNGRLAALLPDGWELWLDGGHNPAAGTVLAEQAEAWMRHDGRPLHLVYGMLNTKDPAGFLAPLSRIAVTLAGVAVPGEPASMSAIEAATAAAAVGIVRAAPAAGIAAALAALPRGHAGAGPARVLVCGSLYLAGHVLAEDA
ncbi:MAG: folylpolyglutamate synthase/dihydrofolate synthase family protein [Alphaproteobacteria bacterium]